MTLRTATSRARAKKALKTCLTSRYPREKYILTDKLTANYFKTEADIRPFFESQLEICGVEYFDFYLMHSQGLVNYDHFKECRAYETAFELKKKRAKFATSAFPSTTAPRCSSAF